MGFKQESIRVGQRLLIKSTNPLDNNTVSNMGFYGLFLILVMPAIVLSQSDSCGGKLTGRGGRFSTPGFPPDTSNLHCEWMIHVNSGYNVYITFDNFILDFGSECITIRDGGNVNATRLDQICRDKIHKSAKYSYTSKDTELFVSFRPQSYTGFSAKWEAFLMHSTMCPLSTEPVLMNQPYQSLHFRSTSASAKTAPVNTKLLNYQMVKRSYATQKLTGVIG